MKFLILFSLLFSFTANAAANYCDLRGKCLKCSKCQKAYTNCAKDASSKTYGKYLKQQKDECKFILDVCKSVNKCEEPEEEK